LSFESQSVLTHEFSLTELDQLRQLKSGQANKLLHSQQYLVFIVYEERCGSLKMICNDFLVVKVNCWSCAFNIIKCIWIFRNIKQ